MKRRCILAPFPPPSAEAETTARAEARLEALERRLSDKVGAAVEVVAVKALGAPYVAHREADGSVIEGQRSCLVVEFRNPRTGRLLRRTIGRDAAVERRKRRRRKHRK